jgi:ABC-type antimicrobial peptide transport system permease subunit
MILKDQHLVFKMNPVSLFSNFLLIMLIAAATAYFPARSAARLSAVEALRHYE